MAVELRLAGPADARALAGVKVRSWRAAYAGIVPDDVLAALDVEREGRAWRAYLEAVPAEDRLWLAVEADAVLGFARTGPCADGDVPAGTAEVHGLYVEPERIGTGLGRALLEHAVADLRARGASWVVLWHFAGNERAARFYERAGFRADGAERRSPHGPVELRLRLG